MSDPRGPLLVLGIGNILLGDDGVGVRVVDALRELAGRGDVALPRGTQLVDGGTRGRALLPWLDEARAVLLVDAADVAGPPGTVRVLRGSELAPTPTREVATHATGVDDLLAAARSAGVLPAAVAMVGVRPAALDTGLELSDAVRAALPTAVAATIDELHRLEALASSSDGPRRRTHGLAGATA
jgi:hydrogenase maturation protease